MPGFNPDAYLQQAQAAAMDQVQLRNESLGAGTPERSTSSSPQAFDPDSYLAQAAPAAQSPEEPGVLESLKTGAGQGLLGEQLSDKLGVTDQQAVPQESTLGSRVFNHPDYYAGYVVGKGLQYSALAELAGATGGTALLGGALSKALPLSVPVASAAAENAIAGTLSQYSDSASIPQALTAGVASGFMGGALAKVFPSTEAGKALKSTESIAEGVRATSAEHAALGGFAKAIAEGTIQPSKGPQNPLSQLMGGALDKLTTFAGGKFGLLAKPVIKKAMSTIAGGGDKAQALLEAQNALTQEGESAVSGFTKAVSNTVENLKGRPRFSSFLGQLQGVKNVGSQEQQLLASSMAEKLSQNLDQFSEHFTGLSEKISPVLSELQKLQDQIARQGNGTLDIGYVSKMLQSYVENTMRGVESKLGAMPTLEGLQGPGLSAGDGLEAMKDMGRGMNEIIKAHQEALDHLQSTPLVQKLLDLHEHIMSGKSIKDVDAVHDLISAAEDMRHLSGYNKTYAESALELLKQANLLAKTPQAAQKLSAARLETLRHYMNGNYSEALETADEAMGWSKSIMQSLKGLPGKMQSAAQIYAPLTAGKVGVSQMQSNLPAIQQYNQSRTAPTGVRASGAQQAAQSQKGTAAQGLTDDLGNR